MRIVIPRESVAGERRTSATPETVKKMIRLGAEVAIESGAGAAVGFDDSIYAELGAEIVADRAALLGSADMVLRLRKPGPDEKRDSPTVQVFCVLQQSTGDFLRSPQQVVVSKTGVR